MAALLIAAGALFLAVFAGALLDALIDCRSTRETDEDCEIPAPDCGSALAA